MQFEDGRPVRDFGLAKGQRHNPGWWWSATTGGHVGYESWHEEVTTAAAYPDAFALWRSRSYTSLSKIH